jgi:hypothetical protein
MLQCAVTNAAASLSGLSHYCGDSPATRHPSHTGHYSQQLWSAMAGGCNVKLRKWSRLATVSTE